MDEQKASEWLLACLNAEIDWSKQHTLSDGDWAALIHSAERHRLGPVLYQQLKTLAAEAVPPDALTALRDRYLQSSGNEMRLSHQLGQVLSALGDAGIPVIVLKGAHLSQDVYDNPALRSMCDIDLLVPKKDVVKAGETMIEIGYTAPKHSWAEATEAATHHLAPFYKPGAALVEIHWRLLDPSGPGKQVTDPFHIDMDRVWRRAQPTVLAGCQTQVLSPHDLLLHLCLHGVYQHRLRIGLRGIYDIACVIRRYRDQLDWEQVRSRAQEWNAGRCVYLTLHLVNALMGEITAQETLDMFATDDFDPRFALWAREQILSPSETKLPDVRNLARVHRASFWGKIALGLKTVFPSPEKMASIYLVSPSSAKVYLYYLLRIWDLAVKYGRVAWKACRGERYVTAALDRESQVNALLDWMVS